MPRNSCLFRRPKGLFLEIQSDWLRYCGGDFCAAAVLHCLAVWTDWKAKEYDLEPGTEDCSLYLSAEQIHKDILGLYSVESIKRTGIPALEELGAITVERSCGVGGRNKIVLNVDAVNAALQSIAAVNSTSDSVIHEDGDVRAILPAQEGNFARSKEAILPAQAGNFARAYYKEDKNQKEKPEEENKNQEESTSLSALSENTSSLSGSLKLEDAVKVWSRIHKKPNKSQTEYVTSKYSTWIDYITENEFRSAAEEFKSAKKKLLLDKYAEFMAFWRDPRKWIPRENPLGPLDAKFGPLDSAGVEMAEQERQGAAKNRDFTEEWNAVCSKSPAEHVELLAYGPRVDPVLAEQWTVLAGMCESEQKQGHGWCTLPWLLKKQPGNAKRNWEILMSKQKSSVDAMPDSRYNDAMEIRRRLENEEKDRRKNEWAEKCNG